MSGVFSDGFQTTASPQTMARAKFHDHTATGKLKALMTPTHAERMPGLHHAVARPLRGDGEAVELARQADGEVADVDHLLHLALALVRILPVSMRDELAERRLGRAQLLAEQADQLAAPRRRHLAPDLERAVRLGDGGADLPGVWLLRRAISPPSMGERTIRSPAFKLGGLEAEDFRRRLTFTMRSSGLGRGGNIRLRVRRDKFARRNYAEMFHVKHRGAGGAG